jgi:hypothetical protein
VPSAAAQDDNRDLPLGKILLIPDILVGRHEDFKSRLLQPLRSFAVFWFMATQRSALSDRMTAEGKRDRTPRAGVQQGPHSRLADRCIQTASREFKDGLDLLARSRILLQELFDGHAVF